MRFSKRSNNNPKKLLELCSAISEDLADYNNLLSALKYELDNTDEFLKQKPTREEAMSALLYWDSQSSLYGFNLIDSNKSSDKCSIYQRYQMKLQMTQDIQKMIIRYMRKNGWEIRTCFDDEMALEDSSQYNK